MKTNYILKPIFIFGYTLIGIAILGMTMHFLLRVDIRYTIEFQVFILLSTLFHAFIGLGIVFQKRWGFYLMKFYLSLLYLGFPVGTYISKKLKQYIDENNIENYFKGS